MPERKKVLTIAGSDSLAGGGLQADLATFAAAGLPAFSALTSIVSITADDVSVFPIPGPVFDQQLQSLKQVDDFAAIKVGMLTSIDQLERVVAFLQGYRGPIVVDPVLDLKEGHLAKNPDLVQAYREQLLPMARVITPNLQEGLALAGWQKRMPTSPQALMDLAAELNQSCQTAVFLKGGPGFVGEETLDILFQHGQGQSLSLPALPASAYVNGAGCTLAAAITAQLAWQWPLLAAVKRSQIFVHRSIAQGYPVNGYRDDGNVFQVPSHWPAD